VNLKEWAKQQGIHPVTAYRWFRSGKLPVSARRVGHLILVDPSGPSRSSPGGAVAVYARVSSSDQGADLDRQVARAVTWAAAQGLPVSRVVTEVGPAQDGKRRQLLTLLRDPSVSVIVVERRDRLARFGTEEVEAALAASGRRLMVVDPSEGEEDLGQDVTQLLTSLYARRYGRRKAARWARQVVESLMASSGSSSSRVADEDLDRVLHR
jgi:predicted site-specific integrase-resolvase